MGERGESAGMDETDPTVRVTDYRDGGATDTEAFQAAIDARGDAGGGRVVAPPGEYETGTLRLRDGVTLRLEAGATVFASPDEDDYEETEVGPDGERPYLVAEGVETTAQAEWLRQRGVPLVQGFLFYRPQPPGKMEMLIGENDGPIRSALRA